MESDEVMAEVVAIVLDEYFRRERRRGLKQGDHAERYLRKHPVSPVVRVWCPLCHGMQYAFVENLKIGITRCNGCGVKLRMSDD